MTKRRSLEIREVQLPPLEWLDENQPVTMFRVVDTETGKTIPFGQYRNRDQAQRRLNRERKK